MKRKIIFKVAVGLLFLFTYTATQAQVVAPGWSTVGNPVITGNEFIGTISGGGDLVFKCNNTFAGKISTTSTSFGYNSYSSHSFFGSNTAFGAKALMNTTSNISFNCAFGNSALTSNIYGSQNCAFGDESLYNNTGVANQIAYLGSNNNAFGLRSLRANTIGNDNCAFGVSALTRNISGERNCGFGNGTLSLNKEGNNNSAFGRSALSQMISGNNNIGIGSNCGSNFNQGDNNIFIGENAGGPTNGQRGLESGDNNIFFGTYTKPNISSISSNQINIGNAIWI
jgi:hypothetical protein